jgi:hypothetical protein
VHQRGRVGVGAGGADLGLVAVLQPGDLSTGEVATPGVIGDAHPAVGQQVVVASARLVEVVVLGERARCLDGLDALAVGGDVEVGLDQLGEQARLHPPRSKMIMGRATGPTRERTSPATRRSSPTRELPGSSHHTSTPAPRASHTQVSTAAGMDRRMRATWPFRTSASPW